MLPFVRAFISIVAGLVRVPAGKFGILSLIGTVIYATTLSSIGYALGSAWQSVIAIVGFVIYRLRAFRREARLKAAATMPPTAGAGPGAGSPPEAPAKPH